jgi:UDP-3-O-[3-hydroxymyristoyl] glucosamine N-acyltransferase
MAGWRRMSRPWISAAATVSGSILGRSCYIGRNVTVSDGCVLGDKSSLPDYSKV